MRHLLQRFGGFIPSLVALTLPITFIPIASDSYILPRASIVIAGACVGVGLAILIPQAQVLGDLRLPLLAAAAAALVAFAFSISWPLSWAGSYTRYESLPVRLSYLGLAAAGVWLLRTNLQRDAVTGAFVLGTTIAAFKGWLQWFNQAPFRPDGDLGNANLLAALIVMAIPIAIDRGRRGTYFTAAWAAAIVVMVAGLIVTTSRSGALGLVAGTLATVTLSVPRPYTRAAAITSLFAAGGAVLYVVASPLRALNDDPPELRLNLWRDALRMIAARPVSGWGEDTTGLAFGQFLSRDYAGLVTFDRVHSGPLEIAATQGLLGLAALGWVMVVVMRGTWVARERRHVPGLAGAAVGYSVWVCFNFDWAPATGAFWLLAGTLWVASSPARSPGRAREGMSMWQPAIATALVLAATVLAAFPVLADVWYLKGRADLSVRVDPLQAQYHWAIGSLGELRRAAELGETEPGLYVQLGDRERQVGDTGQARRAYERALEIDPFYTPARDRLQALGS